MNFNTLTANYLKWNLRKQSHLQSNKENKILKKKLTQGSENKNVYTENNRILMKEIKDTYKWKGILCSWIGRIDIV